jgi:hypothetical protein
MPRELLAIDHKLPSEERQRLQSLASRWRAKYCWAPMVSLETESLRPADRRKLLPGELVPKQKVMLSNVPNEIRHWNL